MLSLKLAVMMAGFFLGAIPSLMGSILPGLRKSLGTDEKILRWLTVGFFASLTLFMPAVGQLVDRQPSSETFLILGSLLSSLLLVGLLRIRAALPAFFLAIGLGFSFACLSMGTIYLMPLTLGGKPSEAFNLGFISVALGAFTAHLIYPPLEKRAGLKAAILTVAGLCLWPGLVAIFNKSTTPALETSVNTAFETWRFLLILGVFLLYFVVEITLEIWVEPYFKDAGRAHWHLFVFWFCFLLGRFLAYWFHFNDPWFYCLAAFLIAVFLGNLAGDFSTNSTRVFGLHLAALFLGPLFPGFLGIISEGYPRRQAEMIGYAMALQGLVFLGVPRLKGFVSSQSPHRVFIFGAFCSVVMSVLIMIDLLSKEPTAAPPPTPRKQTRPSGSRAATITAGGWS